MHHLCDIACRKWHLPYCYAMHVLAKETFPPTNVHSGNPVADGQDVPFNPHDLTPHAGATTILLNLHVWTYFSELPAALTKLTGRFGDVLLVAMSDHLIFHYLLRWWHTTPTTTDHVYYRTPVPRIGDYAHFWTIHLSLVHVFCWARPTKSRGCECNSKTTWFFDILRNNLSWSWIGTLIRIGSRF